MLHLHSEDFVAHAVKKATVIVEMSKNYNVNHIVLISWIFFHFRTVILEVPHFADLCNGQREIAVLNCSEAGVWTEHQQEPLEKQIEEALNISMATEGMFIHHSHNLSLFIY